MKLVSLNLDTLGICYDCFTCNTLLRLVRYPIFHRVYLQIYDDPKDEHFTIDTLLISVNLLWRSGSEMLQKLFYSKNSIMTHFRMIPEPYLVQAISTKL